MIAKLLKK